jgi:mono/diheme cytochrome c family protein
MSALAASRLSPRGLAARGCLAVWVAAVLAGRAPASAADPPATAVPTFARDVAPILFANCAGCHQAGEIGAANPLMSYEDARTQAAAIKDQVVRRAMPPWPADSARSLKMRNDPQLSARDIATLVRWVDAGAPAGNAADLPRPPARRGWLHPGGVAPDAVISLPEVHMPATGEIPYVQQLVKVPFAHDKWVAAMQVSPGNTALVHHMGITEIALADGVTADQLDTFAQVARKMGIPQNSLAIRKPAVDDPVDPVHDMFGVYTPGSTFEMYRDGGAKLLKAGGNMYINFNLHYTTTGRPEQGRPQLALWYRADPPAHQLFRAPAAVDVIIANGRELLTDEPGTKAEGTGVAIPPIPPQAGNYELIGMAAYTDPVTIYQLQPHAHMRAKDFKYAVIYPDGREVTVLTVPHYDFHWQLAYDLATPLHLPPGSKLIVTAHYDNSSANPHLREPGSEDLARNCGPDKLAYFRRENQSWDEMFSPFIQYSRDNLDPRRGALPARSPRLPLVEAVGCLAPGAASGWALEQGSDPVPTAVPSTSGAALAASSAIPRGTHRYELLGADVFGPQGHFAQAVAVKGILIPGAGDDRINVTSLQPIGACR